MYRESAKLLLRQVYHVSFMVSYTICLNWDSEQKQKRCGQKYAVSVECCTQGSYCELVTNVVMTTSKTYTSPPGSYTVLSGIQKFFKSISTHFNCPFIQLKQQNSGHNNIPLLGVSLNMGCSQTVESDTSYRSAWSVFALIW